MAEWKPASGFKLRDKNVQAVEAGTCGLGRVQGCCPDAIEPGKGCEKTKKMDFIDT